LVDNAALVKKFLAEHPSQFFCNRCLCEGARIANAAQAKQQVRPLTGVKPYRVGEVGCSRCSQQRICVAFN